MNPKLSLLQPYPFERLRQLFAGVTPNPAYRPISLGIGEPKHATPQLLKDALAAALDTGLTGYPATAGEPALREACAAWLQRRYGVTVSPANQVLPVNGSREALFAFAQTVLDPTQPGATLVFPNPFYQIYEGAALLAGAEPHFLPCTAASGLQPDFDAVPDDVWARTQLLFICTPGNPTGALLGMDTLKKLIALSDRFGFVIASDECYSEIYFDEAQPPAGLLQACAELGRDDYRNCVVFHSLSKRSNLPGLRSGFVAGDAALLAPYLKYRTYHGSAMPVQHQLASTEVWQDEAHVRDNRALYREKFDRVFDILNPVLPLRKPDAGFYFWVATPGPDDAFARDLHRETAVTVLPGRYLARSGDDGVNPGEGHVRMALVAGVSECVEAAQRIRQFLAR
mgnify:CR=1 FL=1